MKRVLMVMMLAVLLSGCNGVLMNAEYATLLDQTTALSAETAKRAGDGVLTDAQMVEALQKQALVWQRFKDAREGKE